MNNQLVKKLMTLVHGGLVLCGALIFASETAAALPISTGANPYRAHIAAEKGNVAIFGYDPVAYFIEGRAVKGKDQFEHEFGDVRWRFSSLENRDAFIGSPESYLPQYGGFCAVCIVEHEDLFDANPKVWTIVKGKLYLNNDARSREKFRRNASLYIEWADEMWAKLTPSAAPQVPDDRAYKIAVFPLAIGNPGFTFAEDTESAVKNEIKSYLDANESLEIAYSYETAPTGGLIIPPKQVWKGGFGPQQPVLESVTKLAEQIGVQGVVMAYVRSADSTLGVDYGTVELYVIDINQGSVYKERGFISEVDEMLQKAFSKLVSESYSDESYKIAVIKPAYFYSGGAVPGLHEFQDLGANIYVSIRQQPSISISHADEPVDPTALGYLNRGGDWPFPPTNVDPKEAWQGGAVRKTPNLERLYRAGQDLGLDAVVTWFYVIPNSLSVYPVEVYVIDIEQQHVYLHKGVNTEAGTLVRHAFDDFRAGREP